MRREVQIVRIDPEVLADQHVIVRREVVQDLLPNLRVRFDADECRRAGLEAAGLGDHAKGFLVQEMVTDGIEMVVGVSHDPSFGPLVMTGLGGTLVELIRDVSVRITPITDVDVADMLASLRMQPLLTGYRGSDAVDVDALKDLLYRVNAMVEELPEIVELDLNPVFVRREGAVAVDVRMKVSDPPS